MAIPYINKDQSLLEKYCIPSMGSYSQPGSHLCSILHRLDENHYLDDVDKNWIKSKGMFQFFEFIKKWEETGKPNFKPLKARKVSNKAVKVGNKYGIEIRSSKSILCKILQRLENGKRFLKKDVIWLHDKGYFEGKLKSEYYRREADFYLKSYSTDGSLWNIVNACSNLRKANLSRRALEITDKINYKKIKNTHLKSALSVTRGGALRDLQELEKALLCAKRGF